MRPFFRSFHFFLNFNNTKTWGKSISAWTSANSNSAKTLFSSPRANKSNSRATSPCDNEHSPRKSRNCGKKPAAGSGAVNAANSRKRASMSTTNWRAPDVWICACARHSESNAYWSQSAAKSSQSKRALSSPTASRMAFNGSCRSHKASEMLGDKSLQSVRKFWWRELWENEQKIVIGKKKKKKKKKRKKKKNPQLTD